MAYFFRSILCPVTNSRFSAQVLARPRVAFIRRVALGPRADARRDGRNAAKCKRGKGFFFSQAFHGFRAVSAEAVRGWVFSGHSVHFVVCSPSFPGSAVQTRRVLSSWQDFWLIPWKCPRRWIQGEYDATSLFRVRQVRRSRPIGTRAEQRRGIILARYWGNGFSSRDSRLFSAFCAWPVLPVLWNHHAMQKGPPAGILPGAGPC